MSKYSKNLLLEEMDAEEYAEEDAYYEAQDENRVKENRPKLTPVAKQAPKPQPLPQPKPKPAPPKPALERKTEFEELKPFVEPVLETVDDWEAAMDALDAHVSAIEEQKVAQRAQKK